MPTLASGPDQNFSYIAAVRPHVSFIIDIRRDNLLQHVLFKSLFALARNRIEYLCLLLGKRAPADTAGWGSRDMASLLAYIDAAPSDSSTAARIRSRVLERVRRSPVPLSPADLATITRFHLTFIAQGLGLRFNSFGRLPQAYDPDFRRLLGETDRTGRQSNFLAHETDFQFVKGLEERNLVIPVVGDFGGDRALAGTAEWIRAHREVVSAFYTSNVEQYLFRDGTFGHFAQSVSRFPRTATSVMLRSYFRGNHPQAVTGYHSTQITQLIDRFVAVQASGGFGSYYALVTREIVNP